MTFEPGFPLAWEGFSRYSGYNPRDLLTFLQKRISVVAINPFSVIYFFGEMNVGVVDCLVECVRGPVPL